MHLIEAWTQYNLHFPNITQKLYNIKRSSCKFQTTMCSSDIKKKTKSLRCYCFPSLFHPIILPPSLSLSPSLPLICTHTYILSSPHPIYISYKCIFCLYSWWYLFYFIFISYSKGHPFGYSQYVFPMRYFYPSCNGHYNFVLQCTFPVFTSYELRYGPMELMLIALWVV